MKQECKRCESIVSRMKSFQDWSTPEISRQSRVKVLQDMEFIFLKSGCDMLERKCLPLRKLQDEVYPDIQVRETK